ncbi:hypothetical protein [Actinopolymorpha pittospori]|uniref:Uncharacterized protein n=1 Tax=Actinopolymorpha pittospori TaxID=648752 RepID=A0A927N4B8_9ACTN|nr:hypothetical protein [Actinopolymorpha pittospori]MBE1608712.1 hypothetical protein [Actinopolymorpha pittospori]
MTWEDALAKVEERQAERRNTSETYAVKLHGILAEHYRVEVLEARRGWAVRVDDPHDASLSITLRCVVGERRAYWEWIALLPPVADADDFDSVLTFVRHWLGP